MESTSRCTPRQCLSQFGNALGGNNIARSVMHSETMIKKSFKCSPRLYSSDFGDAPAGHDQARLKENLNVVDGRPAGCWGDTILRLVKLQPWECDKVTLPLHTHGDLAVDVDLLRRHTGSWSTIYGSTSQPDNHGMADNYVSMTYSMYTVLGFDSSLWHGAMVCAGVSICAAMIVELWTRKGNGGCWLEYYGT